MEEKQEFREWCLVELFGHQRIAGLVQPSIFPEMLRVDVFEPGAEKPVMTRLINVKAVYALNPIEESVCRELVKQYKPQPVQKWEISNLLPSPTEGNPKPDEPYDDDPFNFDN